MFRAFLGQLSGLPRSLQHHLQSHSAQLQQFNRGLNFGARTRLPRISQPVGGANFTAARGSPLTAAFFSSAGATVAGMTFSELGVWGWVLADVAINWGGFLIANALKTEKFYDMFGTLSFLTVGVGSLVTGGPMHARKVLATAALVSWALRLGGFLVYRVSKTGKDSRFDQIKHDPAFFFFMWTMQAVWVALVASPVLLVNSLKVHRPLGPADAIGFAIWLTGWLVEGIADYQKFAFKNNPENAGKFINTGLWAYSRYPNYFGEITLWTGIVLLCSGSFTKPLHWLTLVSPIFTATLLLTMSGVPIQEKQAQARWGNTAEYQQYRASTSLLVPWPPAAPKRQ